MSPPFPGRVIKPGDRGDDIREWQEQMRARGWRINVTGTYDDQSAAVAWAFQHEKGLHVDGQVGPETWGGAWDLPVTPGPGGGGAVGAGSGHYSLRVQLQANRRTPFEVEFAVTVENFGSVDIPEQALTCLLVVVNPRAAGSEHELARLEAPVLAIPAGDPGFVMFYAEIGESQDDLDATVDVYDATATWGHAGTTFR